MIDLAAKTDFVHNSFAHSDHALQGAEQRVFPNLIWTIFNLFSGDD